MWSGVTHGVLAARGRTAAPSERGGPADCHKNIFLGFFEQLCGALLVSSECLRQGPGLCKILACTNMVVKLPVVGANPVRLQMLCLAAFNKHLSSSSL